MRILRMQMRRSVPVRLRFRFAQATPDTLRSNAAACVSSGGPKAKATSPARGKNDIKRARRWSDERLNQQTQGIKAARE